MNNILFIEWVKEDLRKKGFVGAEQEGKLYEILCEIPTSLQELAVEALYSNAAKLPLELYIQSLRDENQQTQRKRDVLSRFLVEAKKIQHGTI